MAIVDSNVTVIYNQSQDPTNLPPGEPVELNPQFDAAKTYIDNYATSAAIVVLDNLEKDNAHRFTDYTRYRLCSLRGHALNKQGDIEGAARLFLRARQYRPETEDGVFLEINAQKLLGEIPKAFELASEAKQRYPESTKIISAWLQSAPDSMTFPELMAGVPVHLKNQPDVAIGLAIIAGERGLEAEAIEYAKLAANGPVEFIDAKVIWSSLVIAPFARGELRAVVCDSDRGAVLEACERLRYAIDRLQHSGNSANLSRVYITLSIGELLLGNRQEADDAIGQAFKLAPLDDEVRRQYAFALSRRNELDEAIALLETTIATKEPRNQLTWAQMKGQRAGPGDREAALEILSGDFSRLNGYSDQFKASWIDTVAKLYIDLKDIPGLERLLAEKSIQQELSPGKNLALLGWVHLYVGDMDKARSYAMAAQEQLISDDLHDHEDMAMLLERIGDQGLALLNWKRVITAITPIARVRHVMQLASKHADEDYSLNLGQQARSRGIYDLGLIEIELAVLERISPTRTESFLRDLLAMMIEESLKRYLRMRLSLIGIHLKRPDLIERDISLLPQLDEIGEYYCDVAILAAKRADALRAVELGYALFRRFPDSQRAYQAVIASIFDLDSARVEPDIPNMSVVSINAAMLLQNLSDDTQHWYILEESRDLKPSLNEIGADSTIARASFGKVVGDEFDVKEAFGSTCRFRVLQILHKLVFRFQQCLNQLPTTFPDQQLFKKFTVNEKLPAQQQFQEFLSFMDQNQVKTEEVFSLYRNNLAIPLNLLAKRIGVPLFATMAQIASMPHTYLRCSMVAIDDSLSAALALSSVTRIVLDPTAIGTMFLLDAYFDIVIHDDLAHWPWKCLVSERTIEKLADYLERLSSNTDRLGVERYGGQLHPKIVEAEEMKQASSRLMRKFEKLMAAIKAHCEIVPGSTLPNIPQHLREGFKAFGRAGVESMEIAKARDAVLWTDDVVLSTLATQEIGCKCMWTQIACKDGIYKDKNETYRRITMSLLSLHYEVVTFTFDDALWAAEEARWKPIAYPFASVMDCFDRATISSEALLQLGALLLKSVWSSPVYGFQATDFTQRLLDKLGHRDSGYKLVQRLDAGIDVLFGLHVTAALDIHRMIANWLGANGERGIIIP